MKSTFLKSLISDKSTVLNFSFLLFPLLAISLAFSNETVDVVLLPKFILYSLFVFTVLLIAYFKLNNYNKLQDSNSSLIYFRAYLIFSLVSAISLISTINFSDGIFELSKIVLFGIGLFSLAILFSKTTDYFLIVSKTILVLNFIIVVIGMFQFLQFVNSQTVNHSSSYIMSGTFGHKNIFSEMVFMTFPLTVYFVFYGNKLWKITSIISCLFSIFLITVSLTRAVWISTIFGFTLAFLIYFLSDFFIKSKFIFNLINKKTIIISLLFIGAIAMGILTYSRFDSFTTFKKQAVSISGFKYGSGAERIELWKKSYQVFKENPVFGSGLGSWKIKVLKFGHTGLETEDNRTFHQRPHNDFIWILCEQGIIGILVYLSTIGILFYYLFQLILKSESSKKRLFYFLCLYTFLGYLIFSFFSFPKERIEHQIVLLFIFSVVLIDTSKTKSFKYKHSKIIFFVFIIATLFSVFIGFKRYYSELHLQKAYTAREQNNWSEVISEIRKSENVFYKIDPMCTPLVWYSGSAFYNLGDKENAFKDFILAYELNPNHIHVLNNLATCYEIKGDHFNAEKYYSKALNISPNFKEAKLNLIATLFNSKKSRAAYLQFSELQFDSSDVKYVEMMPIILNPIINELANSCNVEPLKYSIQAVANTPNWSSKIFVKSKNNSISFEQQLLLDAIFSLDNSDKIKYLVEISTLKEKYEIKTTQ